MARLDNNTFDDREIQRRIFDDEGFQYNRDVSANTKLTTIIASLATVIAAIVALGVLISTLTVELQKTNNLEVLMGNVAGHSMVNITGHDDALTTTQTTLHPTGSTSNIDQSAIHATPAVVSMASTDNTADAVSGNGLLTVTVIGLDASGDAQTEVVTMTGRTKANTIATFSAVNGLRAATVGSGKKNAGTIWCGTGTFTAGVPAVRIFALHIGANVGQTAYYTVPAGKTLYFRKFTTTIGTLNKDIEYFVEQSTDGLFWYKETTLPMIGDNFHGDIIALSGIVAGSHIRIEALGSATTSVTAILSCELVDD